LCAGLALGLDNTGAPRAGSGSAQLDMERSLLSLIFMKLCIFRTVAALATRAAVLLLDEPTANLDLAHQVLMFRLVKARCRSEDFSAIVITHDLNLASEFADEILLLKNGRIAAKGAPPEVLTEDHLEAVFGVKVLLDENPVSGKTRVTTLFN
jgi:ABC-type hemin transport system ATPase subunit